MCMMEENKGSGEQAKRTIKKIGELKKGERYVP